MRKLTAFLLTLIITISLSFTSLAYITGLTSEEKANIRECLRELEEQGKLSYPLDSATRQELKSKLSNTVFETVESYLEIMEQIKRPIEIEGKILDENDNLFTDEATLIGKVHYKEYIKKVKGGKFIWYDLPEGEGVTLKVSKEGYYGDAITISSVDIPKTAEKIIVKDIILHLIEKGDPVDLEWTENAKIEYYPEEQEPYGWSFKRRWYFPADNYDVLMVLRVNEDGDLELSMKEGGGFILAKGYIHFEDRPHQFIEVKTAEDYKKALEVERHGGVDIPFTKFEWMPYAPELGYEQTIIWPHGTILEPQMVSMVR